MRSSAEHSTLINHVCIFDLQVLYASQLQR